MRLHRHRRLIQLVFFLVFLALLTLTVWPLGRVFLGVFLVADPLLALNSALNGVVRWEMLLAVGLLALSALLGRVFCGYICPMGFLIELLGPRRERRALPPGSRGRAVLRKVPVYVLVISLALVVFASGFYLLFDPLSILTRSTATLLYPLLDRFARLTGDLLYLIPPLQGPVDAVTGALSGRIIFTQPLVYQLQFLTLGMFAAVLGVSFVQRRFWCRYLCPLGALLGQAGRLAVVGRRIDPEKCIHCHRCEAVCPMDAVRDDCLSTDPTRCQLGLECMDVCPTGAISLTWKPAKVAHDPSRRALLTTAGLGLLGGFFVFTGLNRTQRDVHLVRPPGARAENDFLALCSRCGQCIKVCPTQVLQPAGLLAGVEGLYTPHMNFERGYCEWNCNECGRVCPTGAIRPLPLDEKRRTIIGRAHVDRSRCLPWADAKNCIVCQELCPVPDKAIVVQADEVLSPLSGQTVVMRRPVVVAERCIGCGTCEHHCPVAYEAAIRVRATAPPGSRGA